MLFSGKFFPFREKYGISGKFFGVFGKKFSYLGKNAMSEKFFRYVRKFSFETSPPVANFSRKKNLDALFYSESAPQSLPPPQLLEASYAPGVTDNSHPGLALGLQRIDLDWRPAKRLQTGRLTRFSCDLHE